MPVSDFTAGPAAHPRARFCKILTDCWFLTVPPAPPECGTAGTGGSGSIPPVRQAVYDEIGLERSVAAQRGVRVRAVAGPAEFHNGTGCQQTLRILKETG